MTDFRYIVLANSLAQMQTRWRIFAQDPSDDAVLPPFIVLNEEDGLFYPNNGVSIYEWIDQDDRYRKDVRIHTDVWNLDDLGEIDHPTKVDEQGNPQKVRNSRVRQNFRAKNVSQPSTINRKRPTYDENGNVTGEEVWATGVVEGFVDRFVVLLGDSYTGEFGNGLLLEHVWYGDIF